MFGAISHLVKHTALKRCKSPGKDVSLWIVWDKSDDSEDASNTFQFKK